MDAAACAPLPYSSSRERLLILGSRKRDSTYPFVRRAQISQTAGVLPLSLVFSVRGRGLLWRLWPPSSFQEALRSEAWAIPALDEAEQLATAPQPS